MPRIVVIGNAGGGKSTVARELATARGLPHVEIDRLLWQDGFAPTDVYERQHADPRRVQYHGDAKGVLKKAAASSHHVLDKSAEATKQENSACDHWEMRQHKRGHSSKYNDQKDRDRQ
jgi:hypothetical protein